MCKDNAIWPDFAPLARWSAFQDKPYVRESEQQRLLWTGQVQPAYIERGGGAEHERLSLESLAERSRRYSEANRAPSIILDNHDIQVLPAFWYAPLYTLSVAQLPNAVCLSQVSSRAELATAAVLPPEALEL